MRKALFGDAYDASAASFMAPFRLALLATSPAPAGEANMPCSQASLPQRGGYCCR